jgi:hypothetical protein
LRFGRAENLPVLLSSDGASLPAILGVGFVADRACPLDLEAHIHEVGEYLPTLGQYMSSTGKRHVQILLLDD